MTRIFTLGLLLFMGAESAAGQGYNTVNGRNHPELDWQVVETAHFQLAYPKRIEGIEHEAAAIAEATYAVLAANLNVTFDEKIRIFLSDEDEILNGFAVPIGNGYTDIWVHVNDVEGNWTGREKWLRKVLAHELAHIFHFKATSGSLGLLDNVFGNPTPSFWTEGLAQYETEVWDAQRGDRWLRTAVLDDALSYTDGTSSWNGRLKYAVGNSQVRYFAEQYGDSTLADLLAHRTPVLFGLARVHDLYKAFPATIDKSYAAFYDDWRRHVNVYYNTLASQREPLDSLGTKPERLPGQYVDAVRYSPDGTQLAVQALASLTRPVRRLYLVANDSTRTMETVGEGAILPPVSWHPDGHALAYARRIRGAYGSILTDLFVLDVETGSERRLTHNRRAAAPVYAAAGERLAFVGTEGGTANLFLLDLEQRSERALTDYQGDVQLVDLAWHPSADQLAYAKFDHDGSRDLWLLDLPTGQRRRLTTTRHDDRGPVWAPDGKQVAFTSLRDQVPNVFVLDVDTGRTERVTALALGAEVVDWTRPDSAHTAGQLVVTVARSKRRTVVYTIPADRRAEARPLDISAAYTGWTEHRPPAEVPTTVAPAAGLISKRGAYQSWRNLTHAASLVLPYYGAPDDWGIAGTTTWTEPLGKHTLAVGGALSIPKPIAHSWLSLSYNNNQFYPSLFFNLYQLPNLARPYGRGYLVEHQRGGDITALWPLDLTWKPFITTTLDARARVARFEPLGDDTFGFGLPNPEAATQADARLGFTFTRQRPYRYNVIHPLDGKGVRAQVTSGVVFEGRRTFVQPDLAAYVVLPALGTHRLFVYGRAQARFGEDRAQNFLGFSRHDPIQIPIPNFFAVAVGDVERVRGYRTPVVGDRVLFGTAEYRMMVVPDLETRVFGLVELGAVGLTAFADAGMVWRGAAFEEGVQRLGVGAELKNVVRFAGFEFLHAVGVAQPAEELGRFESGTYEVYYRVRAALPF